jgi:hypothetical protein
MVNIWCRRRLDSIRNLAQPNSAGPDESHGLITFTAIWIASPHREPINNGIDTSILNEVLWEYVNEDWDLYLS